MNKSHVIDIKKLSGNVKISLTLTIHDIHTMMQLLNCDEFDVIVNEDLKITFIR